MYAKSMPKTKEIASSKNVDTVEVTPRGNIASTAEQKNIITDFIELKNGILLFLV